MFVDLSLLLDGIGVWVIMLTLVAGTIVSKFIASTVAMRVFDYSSDERWVMFGLTTNEAAATLAAALVGFEIGLIGEEILNGVILLIIISCIIGTFATDRYGRKVAEQEKQAEYDPDERPQRILAPLSTNPQRAEALLKLAVVLREERFDEPVRTVTVRRSDDEKRSDNRANGGRTSGSRTEPAESEDESLEAKVADVEETHEEVEEYGAAADVPVESQVRIDQNVARGIKRTIVENRISMVVIGWSGDRSFTERIFGTVIDQVLSTTTQLTLVAKICHPLNTTQRVVLLVPPRIGIHRGFGDAVHAMKVISNGLSANIEGVVVDGDADEMTDQFERIDPDIPVELEDADHWSGAFDWIEETLEADDLVIAFSPRENALAWNAQLKHLPNQLDRVVPESFVVVYPPEEEDSRSDKYLEM